MNIKIDKFVSHKPSLLGILVFFLVIVDAIAYNLGEDMNWDLQNYHFYNGYEFLHGTLIKDSLGTVQSYLDPILNSFYYLLIVYLPPVMVTIVIASIQSTSIAMIFMMARQLIPYENYKLKLFVPLAIAAAAIFGPIFWSEIGTTMGDTLLAVPIISAIYLLVFNGGIDERVSGYRKHLIFAGLLIGFSAGLKFTNLVYAVGVFASMAFTFLLNKGVPRRTIIDDLFIFFLSTTAMFIVTYLPVGYTLARHFGNPIFPYYNNIFKSEYFVKIGFHDMRWFPRTIIQYLDMPFRFMVNQKYPFGMEISFRIYFFAFIEILIPLYAAKVALGIVRGYKQSWSHIFLVLFFAFSFIVWEIFFSYYRYIAALELLSPLVLVVILVELIKPNDFIVGMIGLFVVLCSMSSFPHSGWGRVRFSSQYFGVTSSQFHSFRNNLIVVGYTPIGFIIPYLPLSDKIIKVPTTYAFKNDLYSYHFTKPYLKKYFISPLDSWKGSIYFLTRYNKDFNIAKLNGKKLNPYHLRIHYNKCQEIITNSFPVAICPANKISNVARRGE